MPQMANITVKAANGTTDVTFNALTPSAGDRSPARWRVEASSGYSVQRPTFSVTSMPNGKDNARKVRCAGKFPCVDTINGVPTIAGYVPFDAEFTIPSQVADTAIAEAVHQFTNLMSSTLVRDCIKAGYSAT